MLARQRDAFAADVIAYDTIIAAARGAEGASVDGRELATAVRRSLDVIAAGAAEQTAARSALGAQLEALGQATLVEDLQRRRAAEQADAAADP